ncbi:hypothetical protein GKC29_05700 [Micromonospora sp. WMMC415]|uniref:hypothetical protein n=1 Tax=Micromonospora sp. WMMC415 TaxID=2675222 RepID=UPI0012B461F0|nr:hypothetical protein [Micromonospora sp. WMMC415]QGN46375.1 hypothetical protein GKC29_05700 [Micromonospora sp. WMMC415]
MDWEQLFITFFAAVAGGLVSGGAVLYQTRRQINFGRQQQGRIEGFQEVQRVAEMAVEAAGIVSEARAACRELQTSLERPGFNVNARKHFDSARRSGSDLERLGQLLLRSRLLSTAFAVSSEGRQMINLANGLVSTPDLVPRGNRPLRAHIDKLLADLDSVGLSLRKIT